MRVNKTKDMLKTPQSHPVKPVRKASMLVSDRRTCHFHAERTCWHAGPTCASLCTHRRVENPQPSALSPPWRTSPAPATSAEPKKTFSSRTPPVWSIALQQVLQHHKDLRTFHSLSHKHTLLQQAVKDITCNMMAVFSSPVVTSPNVTGFCTTTIKSFNFYLFTI